MIGPIRRREKMVKVHGDSKVWSIDLVIDESAEVTEAKALLSVGGRELGAWGRARRAPGDPDRPRIGEELAVARALADLSHQLVDAAAAEIEEFEGRQVTVHL
jgi:hypothetical protein